MKLEPIVCPICMKLLHAEATASADLLRPLPPDQTAAPCPLNTPISFNPCATNGRSRKGPRPSDKMPSA